MYISEAWWYHCLFMQWYQYLENQVTHCKVSDVLYNWFLLTMCACTIVPHHVIQYSLVSMRLILINRHSSAILPIRRWGLSLSPLLSPLASFFSSSCVWLFSLFFLFRNGLTDFKKCSKAFLIEGVSYWRDTSW